MTEDGLSAMPKHAKNLKSIHDKRKLRSMFADHRFGAML